MTRSDARSTLRRRVAASQGCWFWIGAICFLTLVRSQVLELTPENIEKETSKFPAMVKFFAPWCAHCSVMQPAFDALARVVNEDYSNALVAQVDADKHWKLRQQFKIEGYPTVGMVFQGKLTNLYHGPKDTNAMLEWFKSRHPEPKGFHRRQTKVRKLDTCWNVAKSDNGAHAESHGQRAGFGPFKAIDGIVEGYLGPHGETSYTGWAWGGDLQHATWLVAFKKPHHITRIRMYTGVGFVDKRITAFRLLYCNRKGAAYFSGYDTQTCWKPIPNVTAVNNIAMDGEKIVKITEKGKYVQVTRRGQNVIELYMPPIFSSGISIQVMETDGFGDNDGILTEFEVFTEPPCSWYDGCSENERVELLAIEKAKQEELKKLIKEIKMERAVEDAKVAAIEENKQSLIRAAEDALEQAETQFKLSNLKGEYGAFGLLEKARAKFEEVGMLETRKAELDELENKYRLAAEAEEARKRGQAEAEARAKAQMEAEKAKEAKEEAKKKKKAKKPKKQKEEEASVPQQESDFGDEGLLL